MAKPEVEIVVCSRNNEDIISRCMESIEKQTFKNYTCTLVDDCSTDKTIKIVKEAFPWVNVIAKKNWTGPSAGRNIAIKKSNAEFIATLDSDVQIDKNWIKEQIKFMEDERIGIVASKIFYSWDKEKINSCGGGITYMGFGFDRNSGKLDLFNSSEDVLYAHSAAMMVRKKMLDEIGLFDEEYFYGNEDTDIGWRANMAGWRVVFNPHAIAFHDENGTIRKMSDKVVFHGTKNRIRTLVKNYSLMNITKYLPIHIAFVLIKTVMSNNKEARINGIVWNALNIRSTLYERKKVQKTRKVVDGELMTLFSSQLPKKN